MFVLLTCILPTKNSYFKFLRLLRIWFRLLYLLYTIRHKPDIPAMTMSSSHVHQWRRKRWIYDRRNKAVSNSTQNPSAGHSFVKVLYTCGSDKSQRRSLLVLSHISRVISRSVFWSWVISITSFRLLASAVFYLMPRSVWLPGFRPLPGISSCLHCQQLAFPAAVLSVSVL